MNGRFERGVGRGQDGRRGKQHLLVQEAERPFDVEPGCVLRKDRATADLETLGIGAWQGIVAGMVAGQPAGQRRIATCVGKQRPPALRAIGFQQGRRKRSEPHPARRNERSTILRFADSDR